MWPEKDTLSLEAIDTQTALAPRAPGARDRHVIGIVV